MVQFHIENCQNWSINCPTIWHFVDVVKVAQYSAFDIFEPHGLISTSFSKLSSTLVDKWPSYGHLFNISMASLSMASCWLPTSFLKSFVFL